MAAATYTTTSFQCSTCGASFPDATRCKQHCNQPSSRCNRGKAREDFARVIPVEVVFRETDRNFGGSRIRQEAWDQYRDGQPPIDSDPVAAEDLDIVGIGLYIQIFENFETYHEI